MRLSGNKKNAWIKCGSKDTGFELTKAINHVKELGVGEILLSSIENDGAAIGYDNKMMESLDHNINIPIIINSGATLAEHFLQGLENPYVTGVAASNIFYFTELSYQTLKKI